MSILAATLDLDRCPHCAVSKPNLSCVHGLQTKDSLGRDRAYWRIYVCGSCGGLVTAGAPSDASKVREVYPSRTVINQEIPERPRAYLQQGKESFHAPAGAVMLAASAVDSMLKLKGLAEGNLNSRIKKAESDGLITSDMAQWAHEVRLDANDQRHADESAPLPTQEDAQRGLEFAVALAEILFVLPGRIKRGLAQATPSTPTR